ncbi:UDP-glucose 4-epimerase [Chlamydiales bacterium STE3]|nr:UDP-glucose 4-epimerase [Chlamydiales bacterium STE3]
MKKGTIFITGGAGFIGSQVNQLLQERGYSTIVYDNLSTGDQGTVQKGNFIKGDISDTDLLHQIFRKEKVRAVMHFAANTYVGESVSNPSKYYRNNVCGTLSLLDAMYQNKIQNFIFSSSAAVYGIPFQEKIQESDPLRPINPYGQTKLIGESLLHDYFTAYGIGYTVLRYFNAAGGDPEGKIKLFKSNEGNLIPIVLNCITQTKSLVINGADYPTRDGTCVRDYIHVADIADAHILAMEKLFKYGGESCYNLGNGQGFSIWEVIQAAEKVTGQEVKIIIGKRRAGDPPTLLANASKAEKELNWKPRYPDLPTMIEHAWKARQK